MAIPKDGCPRRDSNGLLQGVDRVVDDLEQEVTNLANPAWRGSFMGLSSQGNGDREDVTTKIATKAAAKRSQGDGGRRLFSY